MSGVSRRTYPAGSILNGFWEDVRCAIGIPALHKNPETGRFEGIDMRVSGDVIVIELYRDLKKAEVRLSRAREAAEGLHGPSDAEFVGAKLRDMLKKSLDSAGAVRAKAVRDDNGIIRSFT